MGTNRDPDRRQATDVDDNATINRQAGGDAPDEARPLGGDTDKDPDLTGKSYDPQVNTLRMRGRNQAEDQGVASDNADPSRTDATRSPTARPNPSK